MEEPVEFSVASSQSKHRVYFLIGILAICLLLVVILVAILVNITVTKTQPCTTMECVALSASILAPMNLSADPCVDFANYACGHWNKTVTIPAGIPKWTTFADVQVRNDKLLQEAVNSASTSYMGRESSSIRKAKMYYNSCMNTSRIDAMGSEPLIRYLSDLGSSPMLDSIRELEAWDWETWRLDTVLGKSHHFNGGGLFAVHVNPDYKTDVNELWFYQSGLSMYNTAEFYSNNKTDFYREELLLYGESTLKALGTTSDVRQALNDIWQFEIKLAKIFDPPGASQNKSARYNKMTVADLTELTHGTFNWREYFTELLGKPLEDDDIVIVSSPRYFREMSEIVQSADRRLLANYIMYTVILQNTMYLSGAFHDIRRQFAQRVFDDTSEPNRVKNCLGQLNSYFTDVVSAMYIQANVVELSLKEESERMVESITATFDRRIEMLDWMDRPTKASAHRKLELLTHMVGYPEIVRYPDQLDDKYSKYEITEDYFSNVRGAYEMRKATSMATRGQRLEAAWPSGAHQVNAFYHPIFNTMLFPAGILNPPFFSTHYPMAMNYGGIGAVIGHELTHGFDVNGRQLDGNGRLVNWWSAASETAFQEKAECMIKQYDSYTVGNSHVNGQMTLGENMADNGGMKTAYDAYRQRRHREGNDAPVLPGLEFNNDQLYFVAFAEARCDYVNQKYAEISLATDGHTLPKFRIIGPLQNSQEFAEAFQCPVGSPMNPKNKCVIW